jgi:hypothetical protein
MKRFSEQLHTKASSVKLQAVERRELRERVVSYMEYHPLPSGLKMKRAQASLFATEAGYAMVRIPFARLAKWSSAVAVLILVVIPVMAEKAVPGDGLYAVKVRFNEEVRSTLATTPYEKIEWETEKLNRRIAEARLLADEGRLTDEVGAEMAEAVKLHTENAQREIEVLRKVDAEEAALATIALNTTLEVQSASLRDSNMGTELYGDDSHGTNLLASVIDETLLKQEASYSSSTIPSYEKLIGRVEQNTTRAYELLASLGLSSDSEEHKDITRRIEDIGRSVQEAISTHEADDESARKILLDTLQRTQRLIVFMTEIEVRQDLDVNEIVPVILTPDEEVEAIKVYKQNLDKKIDIVKLMLESNVDVDINNKARNSLYEMEGVQSKIASSTDYVEVKTLAEDALVLAEDTLSLFAPQDVINVTNNSSSSDTIGETGVEVEETNTGGESSTPTEEIQPEF